MQTVLDNLKHILTMHMFYIDDALPLQDYLENIVE